MINKRLNRYLYLSETNVSNEYLFQFQTFPEYPMIRKHIRAFHSAKRFQCSECEKAFTGADKLKAHMVK